MEAAHKDLNIAPKMLVKMSTSMWDITLSREEEAKNLARSIFTTLSMRLQSEYFSTRKSRIMPHGASLVISKDHLAEPFLPDTVAEVKPSKGKTGISTGDVVV